MSTAHTIATKYWHKLPDGRTQCDVCPRACQLRDGQRGLCFVRACEHGEIVLTTAFRPGVRLSVPGSRARVSLPLEVSIEDNGPGIPEDEIPVVLAAFGQGSIAIKSAEQGTGLGLPIVQGLIDLHGGKFDLRSKLREGTEAFAIFPASRVLERAGAPVVPIKLAAAG